MQVNSLPSLIKKFHIFIAKKKKVFEPTALHTVSFSYSVKEDAELRSKSFKCSKKKK